ncbi:MAG TPA: hypothetical protein VK498_04195 [Ferruginibacter sp.]|nr:hypothetical protein [Ferruginibacter sp.]
MSALLHFLLNKFREQFPDTTYLMQVYEALHMTRKKIMKQKKNL